MLRPAFLRSLLAVVLVGIVAIGLGASNVPWRLVLASVVVSLVLLLVGPFLTGAAEGKSRARAAGLVLALAVWTALGVGLGGLLAGGKQPASGINAKLAVLDGAMPRSRVPFGLGAGSISPVATFGSPLRPGSASEDEDTSGYRVLWTEIGAGGVLLVAACGLAMVLSKVRAMRQSRGPWTALAPPMAVGALAANALYFAFDASALLVPNLLVLAAVLGTATAWQGHAVVWRPERAHRLGLAHWGFVLGSVGVLAALGVAESEMVMGMGPEIQDKVLHCVAFALLSGLLCYALGPEPSLRYLKGRVVVAILVSAAMGVALEYAQAGLTGTRSFEVTDMFSDGTGALLVGVGWWIFRRGQLSLPEPDA
jgi:hypothetical protein